MARKAKDVTGALRTFFHLPQTWIGTAALLIWIADETEILSTKEVVVGVVCFILGMILGRMF